MQVYHELHENFTYSATNSKGVHDEKSALGMFFRFIGVSNVILTNKKTCNATLRTWPAELLKSVGVATAGGTEVAVGNPDSNTNSFASSCSLLRNCCRGSLGGNNFHGGHHCCLRDKTILAEQQYFDSSSTGLNLSRPCLMECT